VKCLSRGAFACRDDQDLWLFLNELRTHHAGVSRAFAERFFIYGSTRGMPADNCRSIIMTSLRSSWMNRAVFLLGMTLLKIGIYFSLSCATASSTSRPSLVNFSA
jgi:hypothetical protein